MSIYYVYFYLRSDFTPYYVGKGKDKRAWYKNKKEIRPPKDKSKIILIEQNLTELQAFILERYYIRWFGRKDIDTGILRNKTDGGEGCSGHKHSEISKYKCGNSSRGKIAKNKGKKQQHKPHKPHKPHKQHKLHKLRKDKGISRKKYKCVFCEVFMDLGNLNRYHNEKCPYKKLQK